MGATLGRSGKITNAFIKECEGIVSTVQHLLNTENEWESRYDSYADLINLKSESIRINKQKFNEWAPLYLYMNVSEAKKRGQFSLRYLGQDVAKLQVKDNKILISTEKLNDKNERDFGCIIKLRNDDWRSKAATNPSV